MRISDWSSDVCSSDLNDDRLEHQGDARGHVEMRRVLHVGLPGDRQGEHQRMEREDVEQRVQAVLVEQDEADEHQPAGEKRSEEHTSELQSLMRISYAVFCLKKKNTK